MKARPIIFSGAMVRALLDGRKTQTRRVAKFVAREPGYNLAFSGLTVGNYSTGNPASGWVLRSGGAGGCWNDRTKPLHCPFGAPGELLWCRETFIVGHDDGHGEFSAICPRGKTDRDGTVFYRATFNEPHQKLHGTMPWRSPIHMPRTLSRLTLRITEVRVERLQEISEADAMAEGCRCNKDTLAETGHATYADAYKTIWEPIHGTGSWAANSWVWALSFSVLKSNVDKVRGEG